MLEIFLERALNFLLFWGIWLFAPLLIDGLTAIVYFATVFTHAKKGRAPDDLSYYPYVTVVIPVYNSAETLGKCLRSIVEQSYPTEYLQIICVNNGSEDNSFNVFQQFQYRHPEISLTWASLDRPGKSIALNVGFYSGQGSYLINVDADTWLDKDAIKQVVLAFEGDSSLVAATGSVRVDKVLGKSFRFVDLVNYCEVIEYLIAFNIGRRFQTLTNTLFTLSGAFSAFRRDVILQSFLYQDRTVSEDTDLTFHIRKIVKARKGRIGCISGAIAYVEPVESLGRLYSQRLRWQRGEIEVMAMYYDKAPGALSALVQFTGRILISDHTLAFLRLSWTFLIPFLYFLGYSLPTVIVAMIGLFMCYFILDGAYFLLAYEAVQKPYRNELKKIWWIIFLLPVYRYLLYWFRLAGIIVGIIEPKRWRVQDPIEQLTGIFAGYRKSLIKSIAWVRRRFKF